MSLDDVFDEFEEKKEEDKTVPEVALESSKESEAEGDSVPEGGEEAPTPSEKEGGDDWFGEPVEKPVEEKAVEKESVEEKAEEAPAEETPAEKPPAAETPADDWFETAEDKTAEDQPVEEKVTGETPTEETQVAETPTVDVEGWFEPAGEEPIPEVVPSKPLDMTALESIKVYPIVVPAVTAEAMKAQITLFQSLKASLLDKNQDIANIQGNPFIKRSGWRKFALAFNISDEIIREQKEKQGDEFEWRMWVKVWAPNGRSVVGIGACSSKERDFAHLEHDVYATAHTRAKNRALSDLIGSGEVSWEELRGMA